MVTEIRQNGILKEKLWRKKGLLYLPARRRGVDIVR